MDFEQPVKIEGIDHLDFDPDRVVETEEQQELPKKCGLLRVHPKDPDPQTCGRTAYCEITLVKPCGHRCAVKYLCKGCWLEAQEPDRTWKCISGGNCGVRFKPLEHITSWRRL